VPVREFSEPSPPAPSPFCTIASKRRGAPKEFN